MDTTKEKYNPNPREKANPLSVLFFTYTLPMFKKGSSKELDVDDLYNPLPLDRSQHLGDRLEAKWFDHLNKCRKTKKKPSFLKVLAATFWPEYTFLGVMVLVQEIFLRLYLPIALGDLLGYFRKDSTTTKNEALWYASAVVVVNACCAILINQYIVNAFHYGMRVRAACCSLIYRKALRLSRSALGETASGKIVNLLSNDVSRFDIVSVMIHHMWAAPLSAMLVMFFLYINAGWAGLVGITPVFIVTPLQSYTGKLSAVYRKQTAQKTDERVRLMDEILSGVQVIKMYAWEKPFAKLIKIARKKELKVIIKSSYVRGLYMTFNLFTTRAALYCTLMTMALTNQPITTSKVFVLMSYYNILAQTMSTMFVRGISEVAELLVAVKRLQDFLTNEEYIVTAPPPNNNDFRSMSDDVDLCLKDVTAKWNPSSSDDTLKNISISVRRGELLGVIGPVGSGKSSLLETVLGELIITSGTKIVNGTVSYASQEPWVFGASVRQNILFGSDYNKKRYNEVVRVCSLEKDFQQFPNGDLSLVGDRGASLSGGQKARINLARAVYREADIYLLDDPLSAVDVHVSKHLYEQCINGYLKNKARILVTHQVQNLKNADNIVILENGRIVSQGLFNSLASLDNSYAKLLKADPEQTDEEKLKTSISEPPKITKRQISVRKKLSLASSVSELSIPESLLQEEPDEEELEKRNFKDMQEESSKGKVKGSLFLNYLHSGANYFVVAFVIYLFFFTQFIASSIDFFISYWVRIEEHRNATLSTSEMARVSMATAQWSKETCLYIGGGLVVSLFVIALWRSLAFYKLAMMCSQKLHDNLFNKVIGTTMRFFDLNPSGRILNRFAKDLGAIDELLPKVILDASQIMLNMVGSMVLVTIVNPYFLIMVALIGVFFLVIRNIFLKSSKNIKRIEGIMRGPVFTHLGASMNGLTTIRAFNAQEVLSDEFDKHQDYHTSAWFMYITASSAYGFSMDFACFIFVGIVTYSFLIYGLEFGLDGSEVGLAITQAMALTGIVQWGMRQSAEITNQLLSVERVLEYDTLEEEPQPEKPVLPASGWPPNGKITFKSMGLRYGEDSPLVLKNLNIVINPREKVGIVGRTGAGKSSLISALFRMALIEGHIEIDNINTKNLLLQTLRSKISIIPQDPVLFSGTLRYNLDPFEEFDDNLLYKAINEVELKDPANIMNRLETRVMDRGSNYSVGQRQLICLARAIIRNNKILMLDEATANVDPQTDALIQKTIRQKFEDCTVLTVAHRLNTIMDSDKVLVMDSGTVVEFDHPYVLLQNPDGIFYRMVAETGRSMSEQLRKVAKQSYQKLKALPENVVR
ncbi:ATP-binding cassette subfamily C member 4-like isoform X2 [Harmonia axyridis]|uniref:ATP-binding cassette subfamily C member 4-like isoform X2 n=1 Tax=Harmonia axyridis TaxID=115357 RepID=UPI001E276287|nr:ATP-binding cassette subfamily C member 4-like isoform X2 [Harmonia axyridis]